MHDVGRGDLAPYLVSKDGNQLATNATRIGEAGTAADVRLAKRSGSSSYSNVMHVFVIFSGKRLREASIMDLSEGFWWRH
jgi:hypothetical protein